MNEGIHKLTKKKYLYDKKNFYLKIFFYSGKFKGYSMESFVDCFCFHNNSIWKTNLKNKKMKPVELTNGVICYIYLTSFKKIHELSCEVFIV